MSNKPYNNAIQRLARNKSYFAEYENIEDWVFHESDDIVSRESVFLSDIKEHVIRQYQEQGIFISPSALDYIVFDAIKRFEPAEVDGAIRAMIAASGLHRSSVVIFPLHSFGFQYIGADMLWRNNAEHFLHYDNFRVVPQTNSLKKTKKTLLSYLEEINLPNRRRLDGDLFEHYYRSRGLNWLQRNPFVLLHFRFSQWERFDNVDVILEKIRLVTTKLYFIYALSKPLDQAGRFFSTRNTNNFETLDISHFLTIATSKGRAEFNCLPVHFQNRMVFDYTHLNITLNVRGKPEAPWYSDALRALDMISEGYIEYRLNKRKSEAKYFRVASALGYFRRAVKSISAEDRVINLNTAFEVMLIDCRSLKKGETILLRLWQLFRVRHGYTKKSILGQVSRLIDERNNVVHEGLSVANEPDYQFLFRLFCRLVLEMAQDMRKIDSTKPFYITSYFQTL